MTKKSKYTRANGGGGNKNFNPTKSVKTLGFKPLIATSLAIALGVSVASADCTTLSNITTPIFCYGTNGSVSGNGGALTDFTLTDNLSWNGTNGGTDSIYTLKTNSGAGDPVDITLKFDNTTNTPSASLVNGNYTITFNGTSTANDPVLALQSARGIDMQNKTLTFNFGSPSGSWGSSTHERKMKLDLSQVTSGTAFRGNITIIGGRAQSWYGENHFVANFGSDMEGNITLTKTGGSTDIRSEFTFGGNLAGSIYSSIGSGTSAGAPSGLQAGNTFTFTGVASISGEVKVTGGTNNFIFQNNAQTGKFWIHSGNNTITFNGNAQIEAGGTEVIYSGNSFGAGGNGTGIQTFNFNGSTNTITRKDSGAANREQVVISSAGAYNANTNNIANKLYFKNGQNTITGKISATSSSNGDGWGYNYINFENASTINRIDGNIQTALRGTNELIFSGSTSNTVDGDIVTNGGGNTLTFNAGQNSIGNVTGGGLATITFASATTTSNTIASVKGQANIFFGDRPTTENPTITALGNATSTITNGILVRDQAVSAVFAINGDATIGKLGQSSAINETTGSENDAVRINGGGANNTITLDFYGNANNTIDGNIRTQSDSAGGSKAQTITFHNGTGTNQIARDAIASDNALNTISFGGNSNTITGQLLAIDNYSISGEGRNDVTFTNGSTNSIGSVLAKGDGGSASNTIRVNGSASGLSISGSIGAEKATNSITIGDGNLNISSGIYTHTNGSSRGNTISISNGDLTIGTFSSNATNGYGDSNGSSLHAWNGGNSNTITLAKDGAVLTLGGNITSGGGANNTINFNGANGTLKSSSGNSISANGTTNINITSLTIKDSASDTGTLTTTGGTTNLTFKDGADGSLNGNITTTGGTTNVVLKDGRTYGIVGTFSTSGAGQNIIDVSNNSATISNDLNFSGSEVSGNGGNIINIGNAKTLTLADTSRTATTLNTNSGATTINFLGDSGSSSTGNFSGNVSTTDGTTTFAFTNDGGTYGITGNLSASNAGQNIIDVSTNSATISNDLDFTGNEVSGEGGNIINIGDSKTLTLSDNASSVKQISTTGGVTTLNFNGASAGLSGNVSTSGGIANINFKETDGTLTGNVTTSSTGTTNITITNGKNGSISGTTTASGTAMKIDFLTGEGSTTLTLNSGSRTLSTTAGNTAINFNGSNDILSGLVTTDGVNATTTITIADNSNGTINGAVTTGATNGTTNVNFASGTSAKSLTLGATGNNITDIILTDSSTANTLKLSIGTTEVSSNVEIADNQALTFSIGDSASLTLAGGLSNTGTANIVFVGNNSDNGSGTFNGNITTGAESTPSLPTEEARNTSLAKTTITFADSGTKASTATLLGVLTAQNGGINEINITNNLALKVDSTNALKLNGNTQGNNNIVLGNSATALSINKSDNSGVSHIDTIGGNTNITLDGQSNFTLTSAGIGTYGATTEGATTTIDLNAGADGINFKLFDNGTSNGIIYSGGKNEGSLGKTIISFKDNATSTLTADIQTDDYGVTTLNLGSTSATTATAKLDGTIDNTGKINFDVNAETATLQADNLTFSGGENNINFANTTGATLSWKDGTGTDIQTISTTANGTTNINFNNSGTIEGDGTKASINTNGATASTTITLANLTQTPAEGVEGRVRNANGVSAVIQGAVTTTSGTTTIKFASGNSAKTLTLGGSGNTITDFAFDTSGNSTNNTIILSQGTTTFSGSSLSVGSNNAIAFNLENDTTLTLTNGLTTNGGETTFNFNGANEKLTLDSSKSISTTSGTTTFNLGSSSAESATIAIEGQIANTNGTQDGSGQYNGGENFFSVNAKNVTLKSGDSGLAFSAGLNVIEFANTSGATLNWQNKDGASQAIQTTGGSTTIRFSNSGTIEGAVSTTGGNTTFEIDNNAYAVVTGNVTTGAVSSSGSQSLSVGGMTPRAGTASTDVNFTGNGALVLRGKNNHISNVILGSGTYILSLTDGISNGGADKRDYRRTLVIDNITTGSGSLILGTQTTTTEADTFIIKGASGNKQGTYHFGIIAENGVKLEEIGTGESGAVRLASVANSAGISFESRSKVISDFTKATADITSKATDENGKDGSGYTSYYIGKVSDAEVIAAEQEITATAFTLNYDLYMANLNSLNKRMGELRENAHSQGVWARVFNGALSNNFGLESKSNYTTIQAGYDYAFGFEGANNYLGVALSYALSTSTSQNAFDSEGQKRGIDNVYSNAVEVALYNSYVSDSGWYNDTIAKFSYIMSKFDISNLNTGSVTNNDTTNFALTLGDEVGYVFKLGENKEWSITPQIEATFGYFNQSDFKQTLANSTAYLASSADAVLTLRTRVGSAFAYDFKNFTQKDSFNASLYVGAFYEYDYVSGGGITLSTDQINGVENILSDLNSDGRVVMNVGTNMTIKDNTRLYFDFEKSFGGKITTDYQVNFGVRYSFGESNGYTPMIEKAEFKAPLKVEGEEEKEGDSETKEESEKTQESKEVEKTTDKTQDKSTKDKTQEKKAQ